MWVVVIIRKDGPAPSVVGPFDNSNKAAAFGNTISQYAIDADIKIATLNEVPKEYQ